MVSYSRYAAIVLYITIFNNQSKQRKPVFHKQHTKSEKHQYYDYTAKQKVKYKIYF